MCHYLLATPDLLFYVKSRAQIFTRLGHRPTTHTRLKAEAMPRPAACSTPRLKYREICLCRWRAAGYITRNGTSSNPTTPCKLSLSGPQDTDSAGSKRPIADFVGFPFVEVIRSTAVLLSVGSWPRPFRRDCHNHACWLPRTNDGQAGQPQVKDHGKARRAERIGDLDRRAQLICFAVYLSLPPSFLLPSSLHYIPRLFCFFFLFIFSTPKSRR